MPWYPLVLLLSEPIKRSSVLPCIENFSSYRNNSTTKNATFFELHGARQIKSIISISFYRHEYRHHYYTIHFRHSLTLMSTCREIDLEQADLGFFTDFIVFTNEKMNCWKIDTSQSHSANDLLFFFQLNRVIILHA